MHRSSLRATALLTALCLLGCTQEPRRTPGSLEGHTPPPGPVHLDLAADLVHAEVLVERTEVHPSRIADRRHLTAGWSFPEHGDDSTVEKLRPIWNRDREAELAFHLAEVGPRTVRFRLNPFRAVSDEEPLGVTVSLNGQKLETHDLPPGGRWISISLPVVRQRVGLNRLLLTYDRLWRIRDHIEESEDIRMVSASCEAFLFEHGDPAQADRLAEGTFLLPEGVRPSPRGADGAHGIEQRSGTLLRHHLRVPDGARLHASVGVDRVGEGGPAGASFRVTLTDEDGGATELASVTAELGGPWRTVAADLGAWAGRAVRLDLSLTAADGSPTPVVGTWASPSVVAPEPAAQSPPSALTRARERLDGAPVVLVLLDAFNPFFAPSYGGRPGIAPNLDRLQTEGAQFDLTYTPATYTISSVPSVLTSRYTWEHGAWNETTRLLDSVPTWPEAFREDGYRTVGLTCSINGSSLFGFDRGFEQFIDLYNELREGRETVIAEQVLEPLDGVLAGGDERPLFLWLHIVEPHEPYQPPAPYAGLYSGAVDSPITGDAATLWDIRLYRKQPTPLELAKLEAEYEDNITYVDAILGVIRERLEAAGIWDEAVVMVFSDHGEAFLDHGSPVLAGMGHGSTVYDDQARIPLWVRLPEGMKPTSTRLSALASNMDLLPTVADLVGVEPPAGDLRGVSLAPVLFDTAARPRESAVSHTSNRMNPNRFLPTLAIRHGDWKYIHTSGGRDELYDLATDPGETEDLARQRPVIAGWLRQELRRKTGFRPDTGGLNLETGEVELDEELLERMRALGYVR